tara:strand:+ start:785 stop:1030 length:246 start_codon:yes stop_codon:yes gene_type:complete
MEYKFENGLGASVIDDGYGRGGLFEIALLKDGEVVYNRDLGFSGVKGWLSVDEVAAILTEVSKYDPKGKEFTDTPLSYFED